MTKDANLSLPPSLPFSLSLSPDRAPDPTNHRVHPIRVPKRALAVFHVRVVVLVVVSTWPLVQRAALMVRRSLPSQRRPCRERRFPMRATAAAAAEPPTTTHLCLRLLIRATAASVHAAYAPVRPKILRARTPAPIRLHDVQSRASLPFLLPFFPSFSSLPSLLRIILYFSRLPSPFGRSRFRRGSRTTAASLARLARLLLQGRGEERRRNDGGSRIDGERRMEKDYAFSPLSHPRSREKVRGYARPLFDSALHSLPLERLEISEKVVGSRSFSLSLSHSRPPRGEENIYVSGSIERETRGSFLLLLSILYRQRYVLFSFLELVPSSQSSSTKRKFSMRES